MFHQANRYMVHNIGKRLKVDLERCPIESFGAFGNVSSASIPGALAYELANSLFGENKGKQHIKLCFLVLVSAYLGRVVC